MDQDFYIEETNPVKVVILSILFLSIIVGGIYYYLNYRKEYVVKLKSVTVELGSPLPKDITYYINASNPEKYTLDLSSISVDSEGKTNSTGEYSYKIKKDGTIKKGKIYVKDTTNPEVNTQDITVGVNEEFTAYEFIKSCNDLSLPCVAKYKNIKDESLNSVEGIYNTTIIVSDNEGNSVEKEVKLTVSGENTLENTKSQDLNFDHLSVIDENWNNTYTLKLDKAVSEHSVKYKEYIDTISIKEYNYDKELSNKEIIVVYNKYNYVTGFVIKFTFTDGTVSYASKENEAESLNDTEESLTN